jgi:hypothetical protein
MRKAARLMTSALTAGSSVVAFSRLAAANWL